MARRRVWAVGDYHLGQEKSLTWKYDNGDFTRPFSSIEDFHNTLKKNHNSLVNPEDIVYHLGDLTMRKEFISLIREFNGHWRLVGGNHDIFDSKYYLNNGFENIVGVRVFSQQKIVLSHMPIHPDCIKEGWINYHGHLHIYSIPDERYRCLCIEQTDFKPVLLIDKT